jgi:hypothetical protein
MVFCDALRDAIFSPFSWHSNAYVYAFSEKSSGNSPKITRRSNSAASSG